MISFYFFIATILVALLQFLFKKESTLKQFCSRLLDNIFLISIGLFSLVASYGHVFMGPEIAKEIGWPAHNPFQFEVGMTNLSYGILGIMAYFLRNPVRLATVIGWSVVLIGAFIGHLIQAYTKQDFAPYNFGIFIWFNDLFLPILTLILYFFVENKTSK